MYGDLRRLLASIDYRFALAVRDAPSDFGRFHVAEGARIPFDIVRHLCDLILLMVEQFDPGAAPTDESPSNLAPTTEVPSRSASTEEDPPAASGFVAECLRFRQLLRALDELLAAEARFTPTREGLGYSGLLQGPVSDALTHVGQLTLLRRLAGSPIDRVRYWQVEMTLPSERR